MPATPAKNPAKTELRERLVANRARRSPDDVRAAGIAIATRLLALPQLLDARTVAAYLSGGDEPPTGPLIDSLAARDVTVLCPVMQPGRLLEWSAYAGPDALAVNSYGLAEPTGPRLGLDALARVDVIVAPGLAVDVHGTRIGRGAGYYDRALAHAGPDVPRIMALYDDEVLDDVPREEHDAPVHEVVTPTRHLRLG